jgi:hypothetical protein
MSVIMKPWLWETFSEVLTPTTFSVSDAGPLGAPIVGFSIRRGADRELLLTTTAPGRHEPRERGKMGEVSILNNQVTFKGPSNDSSATAFALFPRRTTTAFKEAGPVTVQESPVSKLEVWLGRRAQTEFTFDWLENVDRSAHWRGAGIRDRPGEPGTRTFGNGPGAINLPTPDGHNGLKSGVLEMEVGGWHLFLCRDDVSDPDAIWPGYLVYSGAPDDEVRKRIREVVGFALGCGFVYRGSSGLNAKSQLVWTSAQSDNPWGSRIWEKPADPPAPLGTWTDGWVHEENASRVASALFNSYDELDFRALHWAYWHAVCASGHIAAGHFGAAIEAVQAAYAKSHPNPSRNRLIADSGEARRLREALCKVVVDLQPPTEIRAAIEAKIALINRPSGAEVSKRIMSELGLSLGPLETAAWRRRNEAAHGKARKPTDSLPVSRDTTLLRIILNRLVLRIAEASPVYLDFYAPGYDVHGIGSPVER